MIEDGLVTKRDITTGISSEDYVEVIDGIKEGEEVISDLEIIQMEWKYRQFLNRRERMPMSNLYEYIKMAVHNIMANKGRSFLTMLGIIIGIASVIAIVSIGEGTKNQMNSEIDDIGGGQIAISVSSDAQTAEEWITADDVEAIRELDEVEGVNVSDSFDGETTTGKGNFTLMVTGEGPDAKLLNNATMKHGVYFGENEVQEGKNVCVISDSDAKRLFGTVMLWE